jgi:hypothetical protein
MGWFSLRLVELIRELVQRFVGAVNLHLDLAFLGAEHDRLLAKPPDHVERTWRRSAQCQFLHVRRHAALDDLPQFLGQREEAVGRAETIETLVRALVIVVLHPQPNPVPRLLKAIELRPFQKLLPDRLPEPFHLAERLGVMRLAAKVVDPVLGQLLLEAGFAPPRGVLPAIIGQHLLGHAVFADGRAIDLQHVLGPLAAEQAQAHHVPRVIIDEADQVGILAAQPKREDVALPHLVGGRPLEEPWLGRILLGFTAAVLHQLLLVQSPAHRLAAHRQQQHAPQPLADLLHPKARLRALERRDLRLEGRRQLGPGAPVRPQGMLQSRRAIPPIRPQPLRERAGADPEFLGNQFLREAFFQVQLDSFESERDRIGGPTAAPRKPPRGLGVGIVLF